MVDLKDLLFRQEGGVFHLFDFSFPHTETLYSFG
jgi:hypothetical protein